MDMMWAMRGLLGGALIGVSASLMLALSGRVAGISGMLFGMLTGQGADRVWRGLFLGGMVLGGFLASLALPGAFGAAPSLAVAIAAGALVGVGTKLGSGCTSGHGVCGISRLSLRSIVATLTFIATGAITVLLVRSLGGAS